MRQWRIKTPARSRRNAPGKGFLVAAVPYPVTT